MIDIGWVWTVGGIIVLVDKRVLLSIDVVHFSLRIEHCKREGSVKRSVFFLLASGTARHAPENTRKYFIIFCK